MALRVLSTAKLTSAQVAKSTAKETGMHRLRGIAAAPGIALGPAFVYRVSRQEPHLRRLTDSRAITAEQKRLDTALAVVRRDLLAIKEDAGTTVGSALGKIFDAQVMIVDDVTIVKDVKDTIARDKVGAESAFSRVLGNAQKAITQSSDPYLREMATEIAAVKKRVINHLLGIDETINRPLSSPVILLAANITPADIVSLRRDCVLGIVTETGGQTSHTALLAKSLSIPAVVGVKFDMRHVRPGTPVAVDGYEGVFILDPDPATVHFFERKKTRSHTAWPKRLDAIRDLPATTTDKHKIQLLANIDLGGEAARVIEAGADGVGLYRTEYLYLAKGKYPTEREQVDVYCQALRHLQGRPLVVRTFDLGSDKAPITAAAEANPALGLRGIRLALRSPRSLDVQFRALLKASVHGPLWVMIPMVTAPDELSAVIERWNRAKAALTRRGIAFDHATPLGIMVETPSAVSLAPELARHAEFFSVGTNDLLQYTIAVDRGNPAVTRPDDKWHPALWRQLHQIVKAGHAAKRHVSVCGEIANDPKAIPFLIGLGLDALSCHPNFVPPVKALIRSLSFADVKRRTTELLTLSRSSDIESLADSVYKKCRAAT